MQYIFLIIILFCTIRLHSAEGVFFTNVNSPVYDSRENIRNALKKVADLGLKIVYPCVWNKNHAFWKSKTVENTLGNSSISAYGSRDILQEFIEEAAPLGLSIVPWFEYGLKVVLTKGKSAKTTEWVTSGKIFESRGWLTKKRNGTAAMPLKWGVQKGFLNPNHPEVIEFLTSIMDELVSYNVDGVLIDDHFSIKSGYGYDSHSNKLSDSLNKNVFFPSRNKLITNSISELLILISSVVRASNKQFILSPAGDLNFSKGKWNQDWYRVVQSGAVDKLLLQIYRYNLRGFKQLVNDHNFKNSAKYSELGVIILSGLHNNTRMSAKLISSQVSHARSKGLIPSYFYYDSLLRPARGKESSSLRIESMRKLLKVSSEKDSLNSPAVELNSDLTFEDLL